MNTSHVCLVGVRQIPHAQDEVALTGYPSVPWAEREQAAAHLLQAGAEYVLVFRRQIPMATVLAWFRTGRPIKQHPHLIGVISR